MSLDTATLYIVATMIAAMLGAMLLLFGTQENIPALKWWGSAYLLAAASVAVWTVASGTLGAVLSLTLNAIGLVACGMVWNAARLFHGRKPNRPGMFLGAIAWIAVVMTVASEAGIPLCMAAQALLPAAVSCDALREVYRGCRLFR